MLSPNGSSEVRSSLSTRRRKWHPRVFTGCATCRRRHVKCDGQLPSCAHCTRLSLCCESPGRIVFKTVWTPEPRSARTRIRDSPNRGHNTEPDAMIPLATNTAADEVPISPLGTWDGDHENGQSTLPEETSSSSHQSSGSNNLFETESSLSPPTTGFQVPCPAFAVTTPETTYYTHFIETVSTVLIIYDSTSNSNPYRLLPMLSDRSGLLRESMVALGALHLANTTDPRQKKQHMRASIETYSSVVCKFRAIISEEPARCDLGHFATSLLLCLYEKMSSTSRMWNAHLAGARHIFEEIYSPKVAATNTAYQKDETHSLISTPMRRFLISLMSYLDVAACCATGEDTVIPGDYWETFAGGWEYNLGAPSFYAGRDSADRILAQIRQMWSRIMSIQVRISAFARLQKLGIDDCQRDTLRSDIHHRIEAWQASVPDIFHRLAGLSTMPPDTLGRDAELLTAAACVQSYALACLIHLERVATQSLGDATTGREVASASTRILDLTINFSSGLNRMGFLWALFMAGIATADEHQQTLIQDCFAELKMFGLQHVSRALDTLQYVWLQRRLFGKANYEEFLNLASANLLP